MLRIKDNEQRLVEKKQEGGFIEYSHNNNDYLMRIIEYWGWRTGGKYLVIRASPPRRRRNRAGNRARARADNQSVRNEIERFARYYIANLAYLSFNTSR